MCGVRFHVPISANASFSVWEYLLELFFRTAPSPVGPASATMRVLQSFLKYASVSALVMSFFNSRIASSSPRELLILSGEDSEWFGHLCEVRQELGTSPRNDLTSDAFFGLCAFTIASIFSSFGLIPCFPDHGRKCQSR